MNPKNRVASAGLDSGFESDANPEKAFDEVSVGESGKNETGMNESFIESKLNQLVAEAVSSGLSHFGGENVVESLLYFLEMEHSIDLGNIANDVSALQMGLDKMFGAASYVVLGHISSDLARSLGLDPSGRSLEELVNEARKRIKEDELLESILVRESQVAV